MSLCLHAGAQSLNRDALAALLLPAAMGTRHVIRPFIEDVELVAGYLGNVGYAITDEAFGVKSIDGKPAQFFGAMEIRPKTLEGEYLPAGEYGLTVGLRGSYDQSLPRGLAIGSRVFVCDNLAFSGEITIATRQTTFIGNRIGGLLRDAVSQIPRFAKHQELRFDAYRNFEIKPRVGDAALVEMVRRGILNPSQIGKAIDEWDTPSHAEHAAHGHSVWRLQQAVTEAIKPSNPERNAIPATWDRTIKLTGFLDEIAHLATAH